MSGFITFKEFFESRKFITMNDEGIEVYLNYGLADPYGIDDDAINDFVGVHEFMGELVGEGMSIIMISSELPEILGMCDRVVVMYKGLIKEVLDVKNASSEQIVKLASGES